MIYLCIYITLVQNLQKARVSINVKKDMVIKAISHEKLILLIDN